MSVSGVTARIAEIQARVDALGVLVRPAAPVAPTRPGAATRTPSVDGPAGAGSFSSVLSSASESVSPGVRQAALTARSGELAFTTVDRPSFSPAVRESGALSDQDLRSVLQRAGFEGDALRVAFALARRESGGRPSAESAPNGNGTVDHGLFQINDVHRGSWIEFDRLADPVYNAQVAFRMSDGGRDFSAWGLGSTGWAGHLQQTAPERYQELYSRFRREYEAYPFAV